MDQITYVDISGKEVSAAMKDMIPLIDRYGENVVALAGVSIAILTQKPNVSTTDLVEITKSVSEYIAIWLVDYGKAPN